MNCLQAVEITLSKRSEQRRKDGAKSPNPALDQLLSDVITTFRTSRALTLTYLSSRFRRSVCLLVCPGFARPAWSPALPEAPPD
jgi:hypothetical protein